MSRRTVVHALRGAHRAASGGRPPRRSHPRGSRGRDGRPNRQPSVIACSHTPTPGSRVVASPARGAARSRSAPGPPRLPPRRQHHAEPGAPVATGSGEATCHPDQRRQHEHAAVDALLDHRLDRPRRHHRRRVEHRSRRRREGDAVRAPDDVILGKAGRTVDRDPGEVGDPSAPRHGDVDLGHPWRLAQLPEHTRRRKAGDASGLRTCGCDSRTRASRVSLDRRARRGRST